MGNQNSINKINYEDVQYSIKNNYIIINTLPLNEQDVLISGTIHAKAEQDLFNHLLKSTIKDKHIIIYGKNCNDITCSKKYEQLVSLGFTNIYLYQGGLFEWMLLQDIYGYDEFPTTKKELDIIKYKPPRQFNAGLISF
jgi:hypothetical protein